MRSVIDHIHLQSLTADEAAALLYARTSDPAGDADWLVLEEWLEGDEANTAAWARIETAMAAFDDAGEDETLLRLRSEARRAGGRFAGWRGGVAVAASVVLLLLVGTLATGTGSFWSGDRAGNIVAQSDPLPPKIERTVRGEVRAVALSDGSRMTLDADSAVQIAFTPTERNLTLLKGRANFDVRHDAGRPFAVRAAEHRIVAVGTKFDVGLQQSGFNVVLTEGRVKVLDVQSRAPAIMLDAGQTLIVEEGAAPRIEQADQEGGSDWAEGFLTFRNQPLGQVIEEMNRYTTDRLVIRDPRVAALRVTGTLRAGDISRFAATIKAIHPVRVVRTGSVWEIKWAGRR